MDREPIHGTTDFWGGPEDSHYGKGRTCVVCGDVLYDYARGNLCHRCVKRKKSDEIQAMVANLLEAARYKRVHDWCALVGLPKTRDDARIPAENATWRE